MVNTEEEPKQLGPLDHGPALGLSTLTLRTFVNLESDTLFK